MMERLDPSGLSDVARTLQRTCGVVFSDPEGRPLRAGFASAAARLRLSGDELLRQIRDGDPEATRALIESTVVGETYFGRHPEQLEALRVELRALPPERPLVIWSAACATGEEAYTIAMLLEETRRRDATVVGTDVSEAALQVARRGRYGPWALRGMASASRERWLEADREAWVVGSALRKRVRFLCHNLVEGPPPGAGFDVVLCRNVLIYFDRPTAHEVVNRLFDATRANGLVFFAPAEVPFAEPHGWQRVEFAGGACWRKRAAAPAPSAGRARARGDDPGSAASATCDSRRPKARCARDPAPEPCGDLLEGARRAAAEGRWRDAEHEATVVGERTLDPGPYLFAAAAAEARGDLLAAAHWLGRALFLEPAHVVARASLVPIYERLGRRAEAASARRGALRDLVGMADEALLPGIEPIAAGALRSALKTEPSVEESA